MMTVRKVQQGTGHPIAGTGDTWVATIGAVVTHVGFVEATGEGRSWGLVLHLLETSGQSSRCRIRFFRNPTRARQIDFQGELVIDLSLDGDAVLIDLTPNELARVEVTLG